MFVEWDKKKGVSVYSTYNSMDILIFERYERGNHSRNMAGADAGKQHAGSTLVVSKGGWRGWSNPVHCSVTRVAIEVNTLNIVVSSPGDCGCAARE